MNRWTPRETRLRLGLMCPAISGHLNPALALASALRDRGHEVGFFGLADGEARVSTAGFEFRAIAADRLPIGTVPGWMKRQGELTGRAAMRWILQCLREESVAMMDQLGVELERWGAEGALIDQVSHGAVSVAQRQRLAYLTLCHALPVHADISVPPFSTTLPHRPGWRGRLRNAMWLASYAPVMAGYYRPLNLRRRRWGLPLLTPWSGSDSTLAVLSQVPAAFEFPGRRLPSHFHLTGPWIRPSTRGQQPFPYHRLDGRPMIYASMGTLQNRQMWVFRTMAEACAGLKAQLVIALGAADAEASADWAGDPIVVPYAPQTELIPRSSLVITHGGLNTTLEALSSGVPMVALPVTNDQPGVAARIRHHGVGDWLPLRTLDARRLREMVQRVLENPCYRQSARRLQMGIQDCAGLDRAADLVENTLHGRFEPCVA